MKRLLALTVLAAGLAMPATAKIERPDTLDARAVKKASGEGRDALRRANPRGATVDFYLTVLHHSDGESQLLGSGDFGNAARFASLAAQLKADALTDPGDGIDRGVIMVSSGDNFLAGPEFNVSLSNGFPYFDSLVYEAIGYDAMVIGNHEFDFGPDVLETFIDGIPSTTFISSNLDFSGEPGLQGLFDMGEIAKSVVISVNGRQVGIVGATTTDLPFISFPRNVVVDNNVAAAIQAEVNMLDANGVDIIILASHLQGIESGELDIAGDLDLVDAIVAGGGGELLANPGDLLLPGDDGDIFGAYPQVGVDIDGTDVPVVSTSGDYNYIGRLVLGFDADGNLVEVTDESGPVRVSGIAPDAVRPDASVQTSVVDPVAAGVEALDQNIIATSTVGLDGIRGNVRSIETNVGNLATDAFLWEARRRADEFGVPMADVALANGGGIRNDSIIPPGDISELDTFDILPFSNFIVLVPDISPAQFKEILENAVSTQDGSGSTGRFAQVSGFTVVYDITRQGQRISDGVITQAGERVRYVTLDDGTPLVWDGTVLPVRNINIAIPDFLARGGDQYPFNGAPFSNLNVSYQQALFNYITEELNGSINGLNAPEGGNGRITK